MARLGRIVRASLVNTAYDCRAPVDSKRPDTRTPNSVAVVCDAIDVIRKHASKSLAGSEEMVRVRHCWIDNDADGVVYSVICVVVAY